MAWNPKALKQLGPRRQPLDLFDREAEAEGNAIKHSQQYLPTVMGKRLAKMRREASGIRKTADEIATRRLVADTAKRYAEIVKPDSRASLMQAA